MGLFIIILFTLLGLTHGRSSFSKGPLCCDQCLWTVGWGEAERGSPTKKRRKNKVWGKASTFGHLPRHCSRSSSPLLVRSLTDMENVRILLHLASETLDLIYPYPSSLSAQFSLRTELQGVVGKTYEPMKWTDPSRPS